MVDHEENKTLKNRENGAIKHLCLKLKTQLLCLIAQYLIKNTTKSTRAKVFFKVEGTTDTEMSQNNIALRRMKRAKRKHEGFIAGCRKTVNFLYQKKRNSTSMHSFKCSEVEHLICK